MGNLQITAIKVEAAYGVWSWVGLGVVLVICAWFVYRMFNLPDVDEHIDEYNNELKTPKEGV